MRRREFIGLLGGVTGALTCADVFAAQKSPIARIGFLSIAPWPPGACIGREAYQNPPCWLASDLNALGWREGENMQLEHREGGGNIANLPRLAAELVTLRPDVLIGGGSDETKATATFRSSLWHRPIPSVMVS